jgi:RepB DNA-primase from phage plasmid
MAEDSANTGHSAARAMLDTFSSVGASSFNVTWTNSAGQPRRSRKGMSLTEITRTMPAMLDAATADRLNLIIRPYGPGVSFIQLDDLTADKLPPAMFLIIETSPGSFQAWLAMASRHDKEFARRVRKGAGADLSASGATRVAGSLNFKDKYAPDFPRVMIRQAEPGRRTSAAELERLGLVAPPDDFAPLPPARSLGNRKWPSYAKALDGAPLNHDGDGPDRSRADYVWCMTAISWGFGIKETGARLMEESSKAREYGRAYADMTATNAALAVERRRQQPRRQRTAEHGRG